MNSSARDIQPADIQKKMTSGDFSGAMVDIDALLASDPENPDVRYMLAVCLRYTGHLDGAQAQLDTLKLSHPDTGRIFQEQGHLHLARGENQKALAAFANACQLNPALIASWRKQQQILVALNRLEDARQAQAQVERLQDTPKALVAVTDLLAQGKLKKAETLCRKFLQSNPTHVEGMRLLAELASRFGELEDAEYLLESAGEFEPGNTQVKIDYIGVLRKRQNFTKALEVAESLYREQPDNPQAESLYAIEKMQMGDYENAIALFDDVLEKIPGDAVTLTSRGHALKTLGDSAAAIDSYKSAIASNPWHGDAYYSLSNLKTYRFEPAQVQEMLALEVRDELSPASKVHLDFALGKAFEDKGEYASAFDFYSRGNRMKHQHSSYDPDKMSEELKAQRRFFTAEFLDIRSGSGCAAPDPIFIVGLPRAGSTLLEQVLSSHSQVDGTLELPNILATAQKLKRQARDADHNPYPDILGDLPQEELAALGEQYLEETRIHRRSAPFFIDKMPNNFRHIGLIKLILPNARIIDARRHPMACCFSGYKQLFAEGQEFSYDLVDIGRYYNDYVGLMDHWEQVSPGTILRVHYENVVNDFEGQVARILDFCGLAFEQACLDFYQTERAVRTASSEQVRQPIFDTGLEQWKHFQPYIQDLEGVLADSITRYSEDLLRH